MDSVDLEVLRQAQGWLAAGRRVGLATVVRTFGSAPRPAGAMLAVADDGRFAGSVSGGCVEEDLIGRLRVRDDTRPELLSYGITAGQSRRYGLPCGGRLELAVETIRRRDLLAGILAAVERRLVIARRLNLSSGVSVTMEPVGTQAVTHVGDSIEFVYGPRWRLLIIGAGQVSQYLAQMALTLDYQVSVCEPRADYRGNWTIAGVELRGEMPDDLIREQPPDCHTVIVALTHDARLDDMALLEALTSEAFYVGALGSRLNNDRRRRRLAEHFGLSREQLARLHGPVGLPIGSRSAAEIAIAILAEITALRNGMVLGVERMNARSREPGGGCVAMAK